MGDGGRGLWGSMELLGMDLCGFGGGGGAVVKCGVCLCVGLVERYIVWRWVVECVER
jgi:hypothetical protein